jgi:hypothetical protein
MAGASAAADRRLVSGPGVANRKVGGTRVRGSIRRIEAEPGSQPHSGGRGEVDGEPEGLQVADVVAGFVDAAGVVAGAEVTVAGGAVGERVPDDDLRRSRLPLAWS